MDDNENTDENTDKNEDSSSVGRFLSDLAEGMMAALTGRKGKAAEIVAENLVNKNIPIGVQKAFSNQHPDDKAVINNENFPSDTNSEDETETATDKVVKAIEKVKKAVKAVFLGEEAEAAELLMGPAMTVMTVIGGAAIRMVLIPLTTLTLGN